MNHVQKLNIVHRKERMHSISDYISRKHENNISHTCKYERVARKRGDAEGRGTNCAPALNKKSMGGPLVQLAYAGRQELIPTFSHYLCARFTLQLRLHARAQGVYYSQI